MRQGVAACPKKPQAEAEVAVHATTKAPIDPMSEPTKTCFYDFFSLAAALLAGGGSHTPKFVISLGFERLVGYVKTYYRRMPCASLRQFSVLAKAMRL